MFWVGVTWRSPRQFGTLMRWVQGNTTPLCIVTSGVSFNGYWIVLFDSDPDNRTKIDIGVISGIGPLNLEHIVCDGINLK